MFNSKMPITVQEWELRGIAVFNWMLASLWKKTQKTKQIEKRAKLYKSVIHTPLEIMYRSDLLYPVKKNMEEIKIQAGTKRGVKYIKLFLQRDLII